MGFLTDGLSDAVNSSVSGRDLEKSLSKWSGFSYNLGGSPVKALFEQEWRSNLYLGQSNKPHSLNPILKPSFFWQST